MSVRFENVPLSSITTSDGFKIVDLIPENPLYLIVDEEVHKAISSIERSGNNYYLHLYSPDRWYGHSKGCGFLDWTIDDLFYDQKKALHKIADSLRKKATEILEKAENLIDRSNDQNNDSYFLIVEFTTPAFNAVDITTATIINHEDERVGIEVHSEAISQAKGLYGTISYLEVSILSNDLNNQNKLVSLKHSPLSGPSTFWVKASKLVKEENKSQVG